MTNIQASRYIYENAETEYQRYYFDDTTGGFILIHIEHKTTASEIFIARTFAQEGKQVKLLSENSQTKTPDAEIDGELWEFKELKNADNVRGATQQDMREGKKQAKNIAYYINQECELIDINEGIKSAIRLDTKRLLLKVSLIFNDNLTLTLTRTEIENGASFEEF
ncbi:MAG: hypothetical protein F6K45_13705 [Kamptonema sp. SIO1D9]|nr:hypothetical protein [Kamptonema sp. SIO1D9]